MKITKVILSAIFFIAFLTFTTNSVFAQSKKEKKEEKKKLETSAPAPKPVEATSEPVPGAEVYIEQEGSSNLNNQPANSENENTEGKKEEEAEEVKPE